MEKRESSFIISENTNWCNHWQYGGSSKIKNRNTRESSNSTDFLPKEAETLNSKGYMHAYVYYSIIYSSQVNGSKPSVHP